MSRQPEPPAARLLRESVCALSKLEEEKKKVNKMKTSGVDFASGEQLHTWQLRRRRFHLERKKKERKEKGPSRNGVYESNQRSERWDFHSRFLLPVKCHRGRRASFRRLGSSVIQHRERELGIIQTP